MTQVKFNQRPFEGSFNNFVDGLFAEFPVLYRNGQSNGSTPVNITENEKSYVIDVVAPGFEKTDFKISVDQQLLSISAERKEEVKESNEKQVRREYNYRSFKRSFTLDEKTDATSIEAKYVNGVLTLNLPKKVEVKAAAKEITIQ